MKSDQYRHLWFLCAGSCAALFLATAAIAQNEEPPPGNALPDEPNQEEVGILQKGFGRGGLTQWQTEGELGEMPAPEHVVRAVTDTVRAMEQTVRAGDAETYLTYVWSGDPGFRREQEQWAKDINHRAPKAFKVTIDSEHVTIEDAIASTEITWNWTTDGLPQSLTFPGSFFRITTDSGEQWLYAGEKFRARGGYRENIYALEENSGFQRTVGRAMRDVRRHVERGMGTRIDKMVPIRIYPNEKHFAFSNGLLKHETQPWQIDPAQPVKLIANDEIEEDALKADLARRFTMLTLHEIGSHADQMPWWIATGIAEFACEKFEDDLEPNMEKVRGPLKAGDLPKFASLSNVSSLSDTDRMLAIEMGHNLLGYIADSYSREQRQDWVKMLANGSSLEAATRETFEISADELEAKWAAWLSESGE
ncbi:MAG: hypothetical protein H6815_10590 [Phycisphaeraceae bacterium]|nr:hypothetical protein [Phycisphaerales bacterium]MCB9860884.1 hypothetical protein [Phycisphaeraceae bacterium]